jgi:hypothetical protein
MSGQPYPAPLPPKWARTQDLGQLFDRTFQVYRRNFKLFFAISIVLVIPDAVIDLLGASFATGVLRFVSVPFVLGAFSLAASQVVFHGPAGPGTILRRALRRYPQFAGAVVGYIGAALSLSSGALGTWVIAAVGSASTACIMAAESLNPWRALWRQGDLLKGNMARALLFSAAILILSAIPMLVLISSTAVVIRLLPVSNHVGSMLVGRLLAILIGCLATPLVPIGTCLLYIQLRHRHEGLDLDDLAKSATGAA